MKSAGWWEAKVSFLTKYKNYVPDVRISPATHDKLGRIEAKEAKYPDWSHKHFRGWKLIENLNESQKISGSFYTKGHQHFSVTADQ